jgi:hypothetical protein
MALRQFFDLTSSGFRSKQLERLVRDRNTPQKVKRVDRIAGQRWAEGGGDYGGSGQEPAHSPPLAALALRPELET